VPDGLERRRASAILAACAIAAFAGWSSGRAGAQAGPLQIELDAFSGRPNPRWTLNEAQGAEFLARLRALQPAAANSPGDGLGYRGLIVRPDGAEIRLYRGTVTVQQSDRIETFSDPDRGLERWLFDSARGHVPDEFLGYISSEMGR